MAQGRSRMQIFWQLLIKNKRNAEMDIKQEIEHIAERLKKNDGLLGSFKKGPVKAVRELLGEIDLPDDMLEKK